MNLLIFIHSMRSGGAERVTANLSNYWALKGWRITIVSLVACEHDFYKLHSNVQRVSLDLDDESSNPIAAIKNNLKRIFALHRVLREIHPDVAIGMMPSAGVLLVIASFFLSKLVTITSERSYPPMLPLGLLWNKLRQWTYPNATKVTMLTAEGLVWLSENIPRAQGVVIPNPIPYPLPNFEPKIAPESVIDPDRKVVLAVGRFSEEKRFELLMQIFSKLAPVNVKWDLVILGEGPLRETLECQIINLGIQGRVYLPGRTGNVGDWYKRADVYVMSSRFEGFPNTLGEAMAHGCAVVSFDCDTGPRDIIRHEVDGILVPNGDVKSLETALSRLMLDDSLRKQLSQQAIEVRERYSMERITSMWENLFLEARR
jgi:glycosyltransferase involved in cell wall biosynthesis